MTDLKEITRMGSVEQGSTISDYNDDEVSRQISLNTALTHGIWNDTKLNILIRRVIQTFLVKLLVQCA